MDRFKILADEVKSLQEIIKRMASNSFEIKKWTVALIVVAVTFKSESCYQLLVGFIPLFLFWYLNAYFLRQERLFRKKYKDLIKLAQRAMRDFLMLVRKSMKKKWIAYARLLLA